MLLPSAFVDTAGGSDVVVNGVGAYARFDPFLLPRLPAVGVNGLGGRVLAEGGDKDPLDFVAVAGQSRTPNLANVLSVGQVLPANLAERDDLD